MQVKCPFAKSFDGVTNWQNENTTGRPIAVDLYLNRDYAGGLIFSRQIYALGVWVLICLTSDVFPSLN